MPENIAALGTESEIGIIEYRTPTHLIVRCAPILLVEHICIGEVFPCNQIISNGLGIHPFCKFRIPFRRQRYNNVCAACILLNNVASDAEKIRIAARKLNGVALYDVYSVLINAVMRSKVILVHVLLKVIQPPVTAVDINRTESCRGRIDVHIENGGACERIANAGIQAVLTRIAKHERTESLDIIVSEERIGNGLSSVAGAKHERKGLLRITPG